MITARMSVFHGSRGRYFQTHELPRVTRRDFYKHLIERVRNIYKCRIQLVQALALGPGSNSFGLYSGLGLTWIGRERVYLKIFGNRHNEYLC
jgi:hypothetical protein